MIWGKELPETPGYYWLKPGQHERAIIVEVVNVDGKRRFTPGIWEHPGVSVAAVGRQAFWSGPVLMPEFICEISVDSNALPV